MLNSQRPRRSERNQPGDDIGLEPFPSPTPPARGRRRTFFALAWALALLLGVTFVGVTALTVGLWLAGQNDETNPVVDLGFFALGALITLGYAAQLRRPERNLAGLQQTTVGLFALGLAGLLGGRVEPFYGALLLLGLTAVLALLHPARRALFRVGRPSPSLAALSLSSLFVVAPYAATMLALARRAGPSCFLGRCAYGDRLAEMAALALAVAFAGLLAATKPCGWRLTAWTVGLAAILVGAVSAALPGLPGALGQTTGVLTAVWGAIFTAAAEREVRNARGSWARPS